MKGYPNDANIRLMIEDRAQIGFDVLNWGKQPTFDEARARRSGRVCLLGNIDPLEIGARGNAEQVRGFARALPRRVEGGGLIALVGGGGGHGKPCANIQALIAAAHTGQGL